MELTNRNSRALRNAAFGSAGGFTTTPMSLARIPLALSVEEERLAEAEVRLQQARVEAIMGMRYDADVFDQIVSEYRAARRIADAARMAASHPAPVPTKGSVIPFRVAAHTAGIAA